MKSKFSLFALIPLLSVQPAISADYKQDKFNNNQELNEESAIVALTKTPGVSQKKPPIILSPRAGEITSVCQLFGCSGGYLHVELDLSSEYTDNVYNVSTDRENNILTQVKPTVWFTVPGRKWKPIHFAPHNTSPGGMQFSLKNTEQFNKYQLYLLAGLNFKMYSINSDLDSTDGKVEALARYRLTNRLTLQFLDRYTHSQDQFDSSNATVDNQRTYKSNLIRAGGVWDFSEKFSTKLDYKNFSLAYEDNINDILDRKDNGLNWKIYYEYSEKTNFFLQYAYIYSNYDVYDEKNNGNNYIFVGTNWQVTDKTLLKAKVGYQKDSYKDDLIANNPGTFTFELQANWKMTVKTSFAFDATYGIEQSDSETALYKKIFSSRIGYEQRFTDRLRGLINFRYEDSAYHQFGGPPRENNRYYIKSSLQYAFKRWLTAELFYIYDKSNSTEDLSNYSTNTVNFNIKFSL